MKIKCKNCGYIKETTYQHDVCPKCLGSLHSGKPLPSLFNAIDKGNKSLVNKIMKKAESGKIVRLI